jgi:hypothetical protein
MKTHLTLSLLLAGLMAAAGIQAQTTDISTKDQIRQEANGQTGASVTSNTAPRAGEASTMTQGQPNANTAVGTESRAAVKAEARTANKGGTISKGDIGTTDAKGQQAGLEVKPTDGKTRAELRAERNMKKAQQKADKNLTVMGNTSGGSAANPAGTPATMPAGSVSVQDGGTAK